MNEKLENVDFRNDIKHRNLENHPQKEEKINFWFLKFGGRKKKLYSQFRSQVELIE